MRQIRPGFWTGAICLLWLSSGAFLNAADLPLRPQPLVSAGTPDAPLFLSQPIPLTLEAGDNLSNTVVVAGSPTPSLQWFWNELPVEGATNPVFLIREALTTNSGSLFVVASNSFGSSTSEWVKVLVTPQEIHPGALDLDFNPRTTTELDYSSPRDHELVPLWVEVFADHSTLLQIRTGYVNDTPVLGLIKLDAHGIYDPTFAPSFSLVGSLPAGTPATNSLLMAPEWIRLQPDGNLLVGGSFRFVNGVESVSIARLLPNGNLDPSFQSPFTNTVSVSAVALENDGSILLAGRLKDNQGAPSRLVRLNSSGAMVESLDSKLPTSATITRLWPLSTGGVLANGSFKRTPTTITESVVRLFPNGRLDDGFRTSFAAGTILKAAAEAENGQLILLVNDLGPRKLNRDGSEDPTFLRNFQQTTKDFPVFNNVLGGVAVEADGHILLCGSFEVPNYFSDGTSGQIHLMRLTPDGSHDLSLQSPVRQFNPSRRAEGVKELVDGKIVIWGSLSFFGTTVRPSVARLHGGPFLSPVIDVPSRDISVSAGGDVELSGYAHVVPPCTYQWLWNGALLSGRTNPLLSLVRLRPQDAGDYSIIASNSLGVITQQIAHLVITPPEHAFGFLDPSFSPSGSPSGGVRSVVRLDDQAWLVGGVFSEWNGKRVQGLGRISDDGVLDDTFQLPLRASPSAPLTINRIAVLPDRRFVAAGQFTVTNSTLDPPPEDLFRFMPDGSLDPTFTNSIFRGVSFPRAVLGLAVDADNRTLVAGTFHTLDNPYWQGVIRLNVDGTPDPDFHPPVFDDPRYGLLMTSVLLLPNGSILVAGMFLGDHPVIMRLHADGTIDENFHSPRFYYPSSMPFTCSSTLPTTGGGSIPSRAPPAILHDIAIDSRGRILAGGAIISADGVPCANVIRLLPDGWPDPSFDTTPLYGTYGVVRAVAIAGDGTAVIGTCEGKVVRLHEDGSLAGVMEASASFPNTDAPITALTALADGRIWIGGTFSGFPGIKRTNLLRVMGAPFLTPLHADGGTLQTRFWTIAGRLYQVESSDQLGTEPWIPETKIEGNNDWHSWELPLDPTPAKFLRLRVDP